MGIHHHENKFVYLNLWSHVSVKQTRSTFAYTTKCQTSSILGAKGTTLANRNQFFCVVHTQWSLINAVCCVLKLYLEDFTWTIFRTVSFPSQLDCWNIATPIYFNTIYSIHIVTQYNSSTLQDKYIITTRKYFIKFSKQNAYMNYIINGFFFSFWSYWQLRKASTRVIRKL